MKTKITLLCLLIAMNFASKAQNYVTIPDANFVIWLNANIPSAMNGNLMDTNSTDVTTRTLLDISYDSIYDLAGIQYFSSLTSLFCQVNQITSIPALPSSLQILYCPYNQLTSLPSLPNSLTYLD